MKNSLGTIVVILASVCGAYAQQINYTYNAGNGANGLNEYGIVTQSNSSQSTLGAETNQDGFANLNLGTNVSGVRKFWHLSKRPAAAEHALHFYYYDGASFQGPYLSLTPNGKIGLGIDAPLPSVTNQGFQISYGGHSTLLLGNPSSGVGGVVQTSDNKHRVFIGANLYDDPIYSWRNFQSNKGGAGISILADEGGWGTNIDFFTSKLNQQVTSRMTITGDGKVGINTITPRFRLEVGGNEQIAAGIAYMGNPLEVESGYTRSNFGSNVYWDTAAKKWQVDAIGNNDFSSIIHPNADGLAFITAPSIANTPRTLTNGEFMAFERMRITAGGYVGIGTRYPDEALTVKGKIHTQEVRVDLAGAVTPDYVFEEDYNLAPLSEIEVYIKANKHLPEVPSAKDMEADGMNLKEMNLILLKKVEELTLHLIKQDAEKKTMAEAIKVLQAEIKTLKKLNTNTTGQ